MKMQLKLYCPKRYIKEAKMSIRSAAKAIVLNDNIWK